MERKMWWKWLGVLLLIYAFTVGMLMPLTPGITDVVPDAARVGETVTFRVVGYNSHFDRTPDAQRVWLKLDEEHVLAGRDITIIDAQQLDVTFDLPAYLPTDRKVAEMTLLLDNPTDGGSNYPNAVFVTQDEIIPAQGERLWQHNPPTGVHTLQGITFPFRNILLESIRNTYFHVSLWFAMLFLFIAGLVYSIRHLRGNDLDADRKASACTAVGIFFGLLGLVTGMIWAKYTWGAFWNGDPKQNMTAIALLIYAAYFVLRAALPDPERSARVSAAYNIFAFVALIPLIYVIPRMVDSLHPGAGGNIAFGSQDLDNTMRLVFYPAILGWTLLGFWIATVRYRIERVQAVLEERAY